MYFLKYTPIFNIYKFISLVGSLQKKTKKQKLFIATRKRKSTTKKYDIATIILLKRNETNKKSKILL